MRFTFVLSIFASAIISLFTHSICAAAQPDKPMNVLFLVADDLNSWLLEDADRYAGKVVVPNLRKFAASGVNFTRAYTAAPVCSPSRTAFFSGVAPWKSGIYNNAQTISKGRQMWHELVDYVIVTNSRDKVGNKPIPSVLDEIYAIGNLVWLRDFQRHRLVIILALTYNGFMGYYQRTFLAK